MLPHDAIHSPVFLTYAAIVIALLGLAGAMLAFFQLALHRNVRSIWLTYAGWLVMIPTIAVAILLGRLAVVTGVTLLAAFGFREFARATGLDQDRWTATAVYALIVITGVVVALDRFDLFLAMPAVATSLLAILPVLRNRVEGQLRAASFSIFGFLLIGWMFAHAAFLADGPNPYGYLIFLILATELNDVGAFTSGRLFGRLPLRSRVSPRKTWGGAIGAIVISLALPWALRFSLPAFSPARLVLVGLLIGVGGQLGDLAMSVVKRDLGIKDFGALIPGHGGILDRIDSLILVAPPFLYLVRSVHRA